jgi:hypothetical protein
VRVRELSALGTVVLSLAACHVKAPTSDAGEPAVDAGADAGSAFDAGPPCVDDGGSCGLPPHAPYCDIWKSPRANPRVEYLVLEATDEFVADDATYARALSDWDFLSSIDFGGPKVGVVPSWFPSIEIAFDDAGFDVVSDGGYHDWDCLNELYRGRVTGTFALDHIAWIDIGRLVRVSDLFPDYASLPHVVSVGYEGWGEITDCGYVDDTCLDIDAGVFTFLGVVETFQCRRTGFRLVEVPDGGRVLDTNDGGIPDAWFDNHRACVQRLTEYASLDGGP